MRRLCVKRSRCKSDSPDYSPALPYRALASLYSHVNDFHSALDSLKKAQQADPTSAESTGVTRTKSKTSSSSSLLSNNNR